MDIQAKIAQAAKEGPNMQEAEAFSGGNFNPPEEGFCKLRLVKYIELGIHTEDFKGVPKDREKVYLAFEVSGPKITPREDGSPHIIGFTETLSLSEKANFFKLFSRMNHAKQFTHMAQMLGKPFIGRVVHKVVGEGTDKKTYANLRDGDGYTIKAPYTDNPETGESQLVSVPEAVTPLQLFLWNFADKEMWDSIFIDGVFEEKKDEKTGKVTREAKSKNYYQNRIKAAKNFKGSPVAEFLFSGGETPDIPDAEQPERTEADERAANDAKTGAASDPLMEAA